MLRKGLAHTVREGLRQTLGYMDRCAAESGHLVICDRTEGRRWEDKVSCREERTNDGAVTVWGM